MYEKKVKSYITEEKNHRPTALNQNSIENRFKSYSFAKLADTLLPSISDQNRWLSNPIDSDIVSISNI